VGVSVGSRQLTLSPDIEIPVQALRSQVASGCHLTCAGSGVADATPDDQALLGERRAINARASVIKQKIKTTNKRLTEQFSVRS
jgi:hypothetical protein